MERIIALGIVLEGIERGEEMGKEERGACTDLGIPSLSFVGWQMV